MLFFSETEQAPAEEQKGEKHLLTKVFLKPVLELFAKIKF